MTYWFFVICKCQIEMLIDHFYMDKLHYSKIFLYFVSFFPDLFNKYFLYYTFDDVKSNITIRFNKMLACNHKYFLHSKPFKIMGFVTSTEMQNNRKYVQQQCKKSETAWDIILPAYHLYFINFKCIFLYWMKCAIIAYEMQKCNIIIWHSYPKRMHCKIILLFVIIN